jgi:hypothetical protein
MSGMQTASTLHRTHKSQSNYRHPPQGFTSADFASTLVISGLLKGTGALSCLASHGSSFAVSSVAPSSDK